jgi:hypothetical protein
MTDRFVRRASRNSASETLSWSARIALKRAGLIVFLPANDR